MAVHFFEKPTGINSQQVDALSKIAANSGLLVGVPLVQRFGPLFALLKYFTEEEGAIFQSSPWRFNAGPQIGITKCIVTGC